MNTPAELAASITEVVRSTPGVAEVYAARPGALAVIDRAVRDALPALPARELVTVTEIDAASDAAADPDQASDADAGVDAAGDARVIRAEIRIAVSEDAPAADICRDVYAAVARHLTAHGVAGFEIKVTVARIV